MAEEQVVNKFNIQKLYIKDASFESPEAPASFSFESWAPETELSMNNTNAQVGENSYEVVLTLTATVKNEDKTSYLVEIHQAGVFTIQNVSDEDKQYLLASQCMTILFPYAREAISDLVIKGGFPPLVLNPVNFDMLYAQHLEQQKQEESGEKAAEPAMH